MKLQSIVLAAATAALALTGTAVLAAGKPVKKSSLATKAPTSRMIGVNVVLNGDITPDRIKALQTFGRIRDRIDAIDALTMQAREADLAAIRSLPFVAAVNEDAERSVGPTIAAAATDFAEGKNAWNLDAINVTDYGQDGRTIVQDGSGVYVAVLDTGLLSSWPAYFPSQRIATQYARAYGGGGGEVGWVSQQPNKWQQDQDSHGTHVTSTIIGFTLWTPTGPEMINGVAPGATIIPVKVLNQNGSGWSSVIARGIVHVANLKKGPLADHPVVINMSLGGSRLDAVEKAAIDYAIENGVIIVASAGNRGTAGMGYPGAYGPVISSAATGYVGQWPTGVSSWWRNVDVPETSPADYSFIASFSSRELQDPQQDLDVAAPGASVVGPYQTNGQLSYYYLSGTSMASPHVAGIVALMAEVNPGLTAGAAEAALENAATPLDPNCVTVNRSGEQCWGADATGAGVITADAAIAEVSP